MGNTGIADLNDVRIEHAADAGVLLSNWTADSRPSPAAAAAPLLQSGPMRHQVTFDHEM